MLVTWTNHWKIENANVTHDWDWPLRENPASISLYGQYEHFEETIDGADHLFLEVDGDTLDDPSDIHLTINLAEEGASQDAFLHYSASQDDYSEGVLEIEMNVGSLEFALFANILDESHDKFMVFVTQEDSDDLSKGLMSHFIVERISGFGDIAHIEVANDRKIRITKFSAIRLDSD